MDEKTLDIMREPQHLKHLKSPSVHFTINVIAKSQLFSAIAFACFACDVST